MKILLMTLPTDGQFISWETSKKIAPNKVKYIPLGLLSLASNISGKHEVIIFDPTLDDLSIKDTIEKISEFNPDVVGISVMSRRVYALYEILKNIRSKIKYICIGGPHTTYHTETLLKWGADSVFVGNLADQEFNDVMNSNPLPKGIINCDTNINQINYPNRRLINIDDYIYHGKILFEAKNRLSMFSSIGCPNRCTFCNVQSKKMKLKNSLIVVNEMLHLKSFGCDSVHILDDNFNVSDAHLLCIIKRLEDIKWDTEWSGRGQINMNFKLLPRLANLNFKRIHVGFESFDKDVLKSFKKFNNIEKMVEFCQEMVINKIDILAYFVIGSLLETDEYRKGLKDKIEGLGIKYPFFNVLFPEPNTEYYNSLLKDGFYKKDIWKDYMENPTPDYEIPYPYGEDKKQEILSYTDSMIEYFNKK